jgi:hypothetical protein
VTPGWWSEGGKARWGVATQGQRGGGGDRPKAGDVGGAPVGELAAGCSRGDGGVGARDGDVPDVESGRGGSRCVHRACTQQGNGRRARVSRHNAVRAVGGPASGRGADQGARRPGAEGRRGRRLGGAAPWRECVAGVATSGGRPRRAWSRGRERRRLGSSPWRRDERRAWGRAARWEAGAWEREEWERGDRRLGTGGGCRGKRPPGGCAGDRRPLAAGRKQRANLD